MRGRVTDMQSAVWLIIISDERSAESFTYLLVCTYVGIQVVLAVIRVLVPQVATPNPEHNRTVHSHAVSHHTTNMEYI